MPQSRTRVVGSGYTTLEYRGRRIAFLDSFVDTGQTPFVPAAPVMVLDRTRPVEIVTGRVLNGGTITANIRELWGQPVWYQLRGLANQRNLTDVWEALRQDASSVTCRMIIRPPNDPPRGKIFHKCVITSIPDDENVTLGALTVSRAIQIQYTHSTSI